MVYSTFLYHFLEGKTQVCGTFGIFLSKLLFSPYHFVGEVKHTVFRKGVGRAGNADVLCTLLGSRLVLYCYCHWNWDVFLPSFCSKVHSKCLCAMKIAGAVSNQEHSWQRGCFFHSVLKYGRALCASRVVKVSPHLKPEDLRWLWFYYCWELADGDNLC